MVSCFSSQSFRSKYNAFVWCIVIQHFGCKDGGDIRTFRNAGLYIDRGDGAERPNVRARTFPSYQS